MSAQWIDFASNGRRRFDRGELRIKFMDVGDARIFRFEDEVEEPSGKGGVIHVDRISYVSVPYTPPVGDEVPR